MLWRMDDAGRVLMVGFAASRPERELMERLRGLRPGGVILFRRNLESPEALRDLVLALREVLPAHPLLAVDRRTKRNPESRETGVISSCLGAWLRSNGPS